jgi:predicted nucleic acid-binding protein
MLGFMLDTNVFNHLVENGLPAQYLPKPTYVTHIQRDELENTRDPVKRAALLTTLRLARARSVATESLVLDVSRWGEAKWGQEDGLFEQMLEALGALNKNKPNNMQDILIAETALRNEYTLITDDKDLAKVMGQFGGKVASSQAYLIGEA